MADQGELYEKSWILYHLLDRIIGSREIVDTRRRLILVKEYIGNQQEDNRVQFLTGSRAEGMKMNGSDVDLMLIDNTVIVMCPNQDTSIPQDRLDKTVCMMRNTDSRPGYVTLELVNLGQRISKILMEAIVKVGDKNFISSEILQRSHADQFAAWYHYPMECHGPANTFKAGNTNYKNGCDLDIAESFPCTSWPREANEWLSRTRLHGWPSKTFRDCIARDGCHLVPVGDKTSSDTFLQWRISFTTAERKLIQSFSHVQFLVYGLLKVFLKQISGMLEQILGDVDILSSYIMKTVVFYAVENTPQSIWQEKNTFLCFMLCLKILIAWTNAGYCPNYFINSNNMFLGKVYGENQRKLLCFLTQLHDMSWMCLSVGRPTPIGELIDRERNTNGAWILENVLRPTAIEHTYDVQFFPALFNILNYSKSSSPLTLLSKSKSDLDEFIAYFAAVKSVSNVGMETFGEHTAGRGNKEKYKSLRKCKNLLTPFASVCTSPGLLTLATYYYQTGNYKKALEMCGHMISTFKIHANILTNTSCKELERYEYKYCGHGYSLLHKCQEVWVSNVEFTQTTSELCLSQLHLELTKSSLAFPLLIPPLPYAVFLSFLCYHELGDTRRRDTALTQLRAVKYDMQQGGGIYWIVHNLLGICYEMVGDTRRALREYRDSLGSDTVFQSQNPAMERIERLQHLQ